MAIAEAIKKIISKSADQSVELCSKNASLIKDLKLNTSSIDLIFSEINRVFGIDISFDVFLSDLRGSLSKEEFAVGGIIQDLGLEQLKRELPEIDSAKLKTGMRERDIVNLLTVGTLIRLVKECLDSNYEFGRSRFMPLRMETSGFWSKLKLYPSSRRS